MVSGTEVLRLVDTIHRDRGIDKDLVFQGIEQAIVAALKKELGLNREIFVEISRETGEVTALDGDRVVDMESLFKSHGRIAALTAKQVMLQRNREAQRDVIFDDYERKVGTLVMGTIQRYERPNVIVNLGKDAEGIVPLREQVRGETYNVGERIKSLILEVRKVGQKVRIVLSRAHPDILHHLFDMEVPEVQERTVEIKALARDSGHRSKVAVASIDMKVDCVGACVGIRGSRIKNIVDELNGEKIDIVRWNESAEVFIRNALKPAEIEDVELDYDSLRARVYVAEDQLALAIGRRGQNVRLASRISGWNLDIVTGSRDSYQERFVSDKPREELVAVEKGEVVGASVAAGGPVAAASSVLAPSSGEEAAPAGGPGQDEAPAEEQAAADQDEAPAEEQAAADQDEASPVTDQAAEATAEVDAADDPEGSGSSDAETETADGEEREADVEAASSPEADAAESGEEGAEAASSPEADAAKSGEEGAEAEQLAFSSEQPAESVGTEETPSPDTTAETSVGSDATQV